jgi:hypothetical protein
MKPVRGLKNINHRKTAAAPAAEAPAATAPAATPAANPVPTIRRDRRPVVIEAKIDVGFGNGLFLRGEGQGLSWNHGIPLTCVDGSTWKWSGEAEGKLKFKLLLNDAVWSKGEDLVAAPGQRVQVSPAF